jgi:hypothetical protein
MEIEFGYCPCCCDAKNSVEGNRNDGDKKSKLDCCDGIWISKRLEEGNIAFTKAFNEYDNQRQKQKRAKENDGDAYEQQLDTASFACNINHFPAFSCSKIGIGL